MTIQNDVPGAVKELLKYREMERPRLERIRAYLRDEDTTTWYNGQQVGPLSWLPTDTPSEIKRIANLSRINVLRFVVNAVVQVMYVDGFRSPKAAEDEAVWSTWLRNGMAARQTGVHRGAVSYGASYALVLPGKPVPVIRGVSPRRLTAVYGASGDEFPVMAMERRRSRTPGRALYRVFDETFTYWVEVDEEQRVTIVSNATPHGVGVVPVVRFRPTIDDDDDGMGASPGDIEPLIPLQDQINITTFGLLVAQHYGAFRQRYIMGWLADSNAQTVEATARKLWTFEDADVKVGEFAQTDLGGYIESREASLRHLATVSQTPAHELLGQLSNLSAEALAAAEATFTRKVDERETVMGESWEQVLDLAASIQGVPVDVNASARWRDTEARSLASTVDALGKMVTMLNVPPEELWDKVPGVTQTEVERWKAAAKTGDAIAQLTAVLERQATTAGNGGLGLQSQARG